MYVIFMALAISCVSESTQKEDGDRTDGEQAFKEVSDPIVKVSTPGFYGFPGGDVVAGGDIQTSALEWEDGWQFRLMDAKSGTVYSTGDLPLVFKQGARISVRVKTVSCGVVTRADIYPDLEVLYKDGRKVWLRKNPSEFMVIEMQ